MPPRRRAGATGPDHLTDEQLAELTAAIANGRRATVYLIEGIPSLGIAPGASARAVSVAGRTVTVRPKGVDDELPFEAEELRLTKEPARKTADRPAPRSTTARSTTARSTTAHSTPRTSAQPAASGTSRGPA
ncbi:translation initiation factor, partial [Rhodococcus sp. CSLK01-03]|nr:translation initiation factor [Rhodococcus indonesiensis]